MRGGNTYLESIGTTIFTLMSALATEHGAINLGQGFPDTEGPADILQAAVEALLDGRTSTRRCPACRNCARPSPRRTAGSYGLDIDWATEVTVTSGATEGITASLMAVVDPEMRSC